jgi:hypothetical protein
MLQIDDPRPRSYRANTARADPARQYRRQRRRRTWGLLVLAAPIPSTDSLSVRPCFTFTIEHPSNATPEVLTMSDLAELEPLGHPHRVVVGVREDGAQ